MRIHSHGNLRAPLSQPKLQLNLVERIIVFYLHWMSTAVISANLVFTSFILVINYQGTVPLAYIIQNH